MIVATTTPAAIIIGSWAADTRPLREGCSARQGLPVSRAACSINGQLGGPPEAPGGWLARCTSAVDNCLGAIDISHRQADVRSGRSDELKRFPG